MAEITPILIGLLINEKNKRYIKSNESIPIQLETNTLGDQVLVVERAAIIKLRNNIDRLLIAFP